MRATPPAPMLIPMSVLMLLRTTIVASDVFDEAGEEDKGKGIYLQIEISIIALI
jgi:hypothetical protein